MVLSLLTSLFLFAKDPDSRVNQHLQQTHMKQEYYRQRAEVLQGTMQEDSLKKQEVDEGTYGVVREAPEEELPDFTSPSRVYRPNPLESSTESVHQKKQLKRYEEVLQREYIKQYIRNAEQDDVNVYINDEKVIDDYRQNQKARPRSRGPSGQK